RQPGAFLVPAVRGNATVAPLPSIAVRAVMNAASVEAIDAFQPGQLVDDTSREQQLPAVLARAVFEHDFESLVERDCVHHSPDTELHGLVLAQVFPRFPHELTRCSSIACEKAVHVT